MLSVFGGVVAIKSLERMVPLQGKLGTLDGPANELRLVHVRGEGGHDAEMGWMLDEGSQRLSILPCRERPESLRERPGKKSVAELATRCRQLFHDLSRIKEIGE